MINEVSNITYELALLNGGTFGGETLRNITMFDRGSSRGQSIVSQFHPCRIAASYYSIVTKSNLAKDLAVFIEKAVNLFNARNKNSLGIDAMRIENSKDALNPVYVVRLKGSDTIVGVLRPASKVSLEIKSKEVK